MARVEYGTWSCSRCGQSGYLPRSGYENWSQFPENVAFVVAHQEQCFTKEEREQGISGTDFFVGTTTHRAS